MTLLPANALRMSSLWRKKKKKRPSTASVSDGLRSLHALHVKDAAEDATG